MANLIQGHKRHFVSYLRRRLSPGDDLESAYGTARMRVLERARKAPIKDVIAYMFGALRHAVFDIQRNPWRKALRFRSPDRLESVSDERQCLDEDQPAALELDRKLDEILEGLSEVHRDVLRLSAVEGLSVPEIARQLGRPESTVANQLTRIRKAFDALRPDGHGE
jgi:RNA polymerase sigma factor (sigma-70 family)